MPEYKRYKLVGYQDLEKLNYYTLTLERNNELKDVTIRKWSMPRHDLDELMEADCFMSAYVTNSGEVWGYEIVWA